MFKKKYFYIIALIALFIVFWLVGLFPHSSVSKALGENIELVRVGMLGEKTNFGFVKVPISKNKYDFKFLNVLVDLNNNQEFASYNINKQIQPEWLIQNMPVRFIGDQNVFSFFFPDQSAETKMPSTGFSLRAVLSINPITTDNWDGAIPKDSPFKDKNIKITFEDIGDLQSLTIGQDGGQGDFDNNGYANFANSAQTKIETIDEFHIGVPDINQKKNECAPTSAANSLLWLAKKFKFEDKLPSQAKLIEELKKDMNWKVTGISPNNFLLGKKKITARRKLPLINHKIGGFNGDNTFNQIAQELRKGQDVEMRLQYKDYLGQPRGGHWVTVVGIRRFSSGTELLEIHDPLSPGPAKLQIYRLHEEDDYGVRLSNYPYGRAYISFAIAESYVQPKSEKANTPSPAPAPAEDQPQPKKEDTTTISLSPNNLSFEHLIGTSSCPQLIGTMQISQNKDGQAKSWRIQGPLPTWLAVEQSGPLPSTLDFRFNCLLKEYVSQTLSGALSFIATDKNNNPLGQPVKIKINGHIKAD